MLFDNPAEGIQLYACGAVPPVTVVVSVILLPEHIELFGIVLIVGLGYTVTLLFAVTLPHSLVTVSAML